MTNKTRGEASLEFAKAIMDVTYAHIPHIADMTVEQFESIAHAHACAIGIAATVTAARNDKRIDGLMNEDTK